MELKDKTFKDNSISEDQQESEKVCKICYELEGTDNPIITPCECSGSMKYVHDKCLKTWILSQEKCPKTYNCDICKYKINMNIKEKRIFTTKHFKSDILKIMILVFSISISASIFIFISYTLFSGSDSSITSSGKIYLSVLIVICLVVKVTLLVILVKIVKSRCFEIVIDKWVILSNYKQIEKVDVTYLTEYFEQRLGNKYSRIQKYVIRPEESEFMIKNSEIHSLDSSEVRDRIELNLGGQIGSPALPNEVEKLSLGT